MPAADARANRTDQVVGDVTECSSNAYGEDASVHLANALVPQSDRIGITAQRRDGGQRELTIDFRSRSAAAGAARTWWLGSLAGVVGLFGLAAARWRPAATVTASRRVELGV